MTAEQCPHCMEWSEIDCENKCFECDEILCNDCFPFEDTYCDECTEEVNKKLAY